MIILAGFKDTKILNALAGTQTPISSSAGLYAIQLHHKSKFKVDKVGFEPTAFSSQARHSTNWDTCPYNYKRSSRDSNPDLGLRRPVFFPVLLQERECYSWESNPNLNLGKAVCCLLSPLKHIWMDRGGFQPPLSPRSRGVLAIKLPAQFTR